MGGLVEITTGSSQGYRSGELNIQTPSASSISSSGTSGQISIATGKVQGISCFL